MSTPRRSLALEAKRAEILRTLDGLIAAGVLELPAWLDSLPNVRARAVRADWTRLDVMEAALYDSIECGGAGELEGWGYEPPF